MKEHEFDTYCGLCCENCEYKDEMNCGGCIATQGHPFHGECEVAKCAIEKGRRFCGECSEIPCELLKRYSFDPVHGDNGQRIESCQRIKAALVKKGRVGVNPVAYCGFECTTCFFGEWCSGCRSEYNCCSFATISQGGVCPQVSCCKERGHDGCWECSELEGCTKGYYGQKDEYFCKAAAMYIRAHGEQAYVCALEAARASGLNYPKSFDATGSVMGALEMLERFTGKTAKATKSAGQDGAASVQA